MLLAISVHLQVESEAEMSNREMDPEQESLVVKLFLESVAADLQYHMVDTSTTNEPNPFFGSFVRAI